MKRSLFLSMFAAFMLAGIACQAQDSQQKASPAATVSQKINSGATITISYSQPALKGRVIGKDVEPFEGKIWRAGANEATVFQTDKDVTIEGQMLPAGKYALFTIANGDNWTIIFNKVWKTWGAFDYEKNKGEDALKVQVKAKKTSEPIERLTYTIDKSGKVTLTWGTLDVSFNVK